MKYSIHIEDEAFQDLDSISTYLEQQRVGYGEKFMDAYDAVIALLKTHPQLFRIRRGTKRIVSVSGFSYLIIYKLYQRKVVVFRIVHAKAGSIKKYGRRTT